MGKVKLKLSQNQSGNNQKRISSFFQKAPYPIVSALDSKISDESNGQNVCIPDSSVTVTSNLFLANSLLSGKIDTKSADQIDIVLETPETDRKTQYTSIRSDRQLAPDINNSVGTPSKFHADPLNSNSVPIVALKQESIHTSPVLSESNELSTKISPVLTTVGDNNKLTESNSLLLEDVSNNKKRYLGRSFLTSVTNIATVSNFSKKPTACNSGKNCSAASAVPYEKRLKDAVSSSETEGLHNISVITNLLNPVERYNNSAIFKRGASQGLSPNPKRVPCENSGEALPESGADTCEMSSKVLVQKPYSRPVWGLTKKKSITGIKLVDLFTSIDNITDDIRSSSSGNNTKQDCYTQLIENKTYSTDKDTVLAEILCDLSNMPNVPQKLPATNGIIKETCKVSCKELISYNLAGQVTGELNANMPKEFITNCRRNTDVDESSNLVLESSTSLSQTTSSQNEDSENTKELEPKLDNLHLSSQPANCAAVNNHVTSSQKVDTTKRFDPLSSSPLASNYGRHIVVDVCITEKRDICLKLRPWDCVDVIKVAYLCGFWSDTHLEVGDIVNVIGSFNADGICYITDKENFIVINPDYLVSGTAVVSGAHCMRRSVLNSKFKKSAGRNSAMLYGTICHSVFQKAMQAINFNLESLNSYLSMELTSLKILHDMYAMNMNEEAVRTEVSKYLPLMQQFAGKCVKSVTSQSTSANNCKKILSVVDIEENIWSPRFGLKGKIDLTVLVENTKKNESSMLMPLELKTGRVSNSSEHHGQVMLYSLMLAERYNANFLRNHNTLDEITDGLLLYLNKPDDLKSVPFTKASLRGLLQLRNELSRYVHVKSSSILGIRILPEPLNDHRWCSQCSQLLNCTLYQRSLEQTSYPASHAMSQLVPETLSHLSPSHLNYFSQWVEWLHMEMIEELKKRNTANIWCSTGQEREEMGESICNLCLADNISLQIDADHWLVHFVREKSISVKELRTVFVKGDRVVLSGENKPFVALATGTIEEATAERLSVIVDRDLCSSDVYSALVYRIDSNDVFDTFSTLLSNLSSLMIDSPSTHRMRQLIIDRVSPEFEPTMSKSTIEKMKNTFQSLNRPQKTAILKVLMCKDYVLVKGYPGTGKTATIVALVRVLLALNYSVLITSFTNSAVDNILLRLKECNLDFIRVGRLERIHPSLHSYAAENLTKSIENVEQLSKFYESQRVVAATCFGTSHPLFQHRRFDICIVDEAAQILQPACIGPLLCSKRFVLVGDPLQLAPVVVNKSARESGMSESLFSILAQTASAFQLNYQYRMNSEIMRLCNELVYDGALCCGTNEIAESTLHVTNPGLLESQVDWLRSCLSSESKDAVVFVDTDQSCHKELNEIEPPVKNSFEADIVTHLIEAAVKVGVREEDIGVIAPYMEQVRLLQTKLSALSHEFSILSKVEVNTVDQYQGRDKVMVIVSMVRRPDSKGPVSEILKDRRRLNVLLTRARHKLVIIGSKTALSEYEPWQFLLSSILRTNQCIYVPS